MGDVMIPDVTSAERDLSKVVLDVQNMLAVAKTLQIVDDITLNGANQMVVDLAPIKKKIKERNDFFTKDIKQHVKKIDAFFKGVLEQVVGADELLRYKIVQYRQEQRKLQEELQEALRESADQPVTTTDVAVIQPKSVRVNGGQVTGSKVWDFEISDITQIPDDLVREVINTAKGRDALESVIRSYVKGGKRVIPGVRIYETEQLSVRA